MKIAVIGAGISGLSCAWRLAAEHEVTLYEANAYLGGHTHTVEACVDGITHPVDTGFLVFNHRTYPEFTRLLEVLGVAAAASEMTFSVRAERPGAGAIEWAGTSLNTVFAQRRNLLRPGFVRMLVDIVRFNRLATAMAKDESAQKPDDLSLGEFLSCHGFSDTFRNWYLLPMAAAIWSCPPDTMLAFPAATFARFCHNHGLLQVINRPQWYTVKNGAREYVARLVSALKDVRMHQPVRAVRRVTQGSATRVEVTTDQGTESFDHVVMASHSDETLAMLSDASPTEQGLLGAVRYQMNRAVLHTDARLLPEEKTAWAAWNYQCLANDTGQRDVCVHYLLNKLQPLPFTRPVIVSLNPVNEPAGEAVLQEFHYSHPVFDQAAIDAQPQIEALQGMNNTWFAGAWTGYGFHEDGLRSGFRVARLLTARIAQTQEAQLAGIAA